MWTWVFLLASLTFTATMQQELTLSVPSQVTTVVENCETIRVSWNAVPFNGTQLDTYKVFYKENSSDSEMMMMVNGLQASLTELTFASTYKISVAAVKSNTTGPRSPEVLNTTFGAVEATNLQVHNVTNQSAIFTWEVTHPLIGCNGKLLDPPFRVRYKVANATHIYKINNIRKTRIELQSLLPFTNYTAYVVTADPSGQNAGSSRLHFYSLPGVPSTPLNVRTMTDTSVPSQLLIIWEEPSILNGIISHYNVEFGEQGSGFQIVNTSDKQLLLTGLNPSTVYTVRVQANNFAKLDRNESDVIPGSFTNATTVRLPDPLPVPPGHPRDFKVTHHILYGTSIELVFSWKPPSTGDPVKTYWINCTKFTADGRKIGPLSFRITLPTSPLKARLKAVPFTGYHCHSYASNDVGNGPFSRNVTVPPVPVASSPVRQLSAMPLNHTHVKLTWNKPNDRNEYIHSYFVTLRSLSSNNNVTNFTIPVGTTSLMVKSLMGNTQYTFDVIAVSIFNGKQLNSNTTNTDVITPIGTPSSPRNVIVEAIDNATVQVHWSPPMPTNGNITHYRVDAEVKSSYNTENGQQEFSNSFSITVQQHYYNTPLLTPGTKYSFNITAYTNGGPGPTTTERASLDKGREDAITYFQLKLTPFTDCSKSQDPTIKEHIRDQLVHGLEEECACVLDRDTITDIKTQCKVEDSNLIYIGRIIGTKELRPLVLLGLLENWQDKDSSLLNVSGESLMMDQSCPLRLSSPRDRNCVPDVIPTAPPVVTNPRPSSSTTTPSASPKPTATVAELQENNDDIEINIPILAACVIGGIFLGCLITLLILLIVFCCHIRKRRKFIVEEAIYARPSRRNKRIKVTAVNGEKNPVSMQSCPAYAVNDNSDYAIPRKRSGSIDSVDLQLHRTESKVKGVQNPVPYTPSPPPASYTPQPPTPYTPQPPAPYTPQLPRAHNHNTPKAFYFSPTKQAMSLDNLSSYANGHVANGSKEPLYQAPRFPSLSVDDLLNGVPSRRFHHTCSPLHSSAKSTPKCVPKIPKDAYDDPRKPAVVPISDNTYDVPKNYIQPGTSPLLVDDVRASPRSMRRIPEDDYDDPRKPSAVPVDNSTYDTPRKTNEPLGTPTKPLLVDDNGESPKFIQRTPEDAYDDPRKPSAIPVDNSTYDSPRKTYDHTPLGTPTKPLLGDDNGESPKLIQRTPEDAYDDPRKPSVISVDNSTYDSPRRPYDYKQLGTPTSTKPLLRDDKDDPDYAYVE